MTTLRATAPGWFWLIAILLLVWNLIGIAAFYMDVTASPESLAALPEYDRALMASRPKWQLWAYGIAVWAGTFGALALVLRRRIAALLFTVSLIGVIGSMGWALAMTDLIAVKGLVTAAAFPLFIFAVALASIGVARMAAARRWLA